MKIVAAHQPAYIPWLGYFHKMLLCDEFVIMDDVQFEKNSFINRNKILQNKKAIWLTIPVATKDYRLKSIREIKISNDQWKRKHLMSIEQGYKKYACFEEIMPIAEEVLQTNSAFLIDYTNRFLFQIIEYLGIDIPITYASDLAIASNKLDYVIELTKRLKGDMFVFGALGKDYADEKILTKHNITPYFQQYDHPEYKQPTTEFVPYLSVLDLLFSYGKTTLHIIHQGNISKNDLRLKARIDGI